LPQERDDLAPPKDAAVRSRRHERFFPELLASRYRIVALGTGGMLVYRADDLKIIGWSRSFLPQIWR
jgi:hypothetical protein